MEQKDRRFAVLIDADNVSPKYIKYILDEVSDQGVATYNGSTETGQTFQSAAGKNSSFSIRSIPFSSTATQTEKTPPIPR